ncbi:MAG: FixH family protein [Reyranella sp.]
MRHLIASALLAALAATAAAQQASRPRVELACQPTDIALTYLCTVSVADSAGQPINGVTVTLSADMPSMPMTHNVAPVKAQPVPGQTGSYQGRLVLEMTGEWVIRLRFEAPRPDVVVRKLDFQKDKVLAVVPR